MQRTGPNTTAPPPCYVAARGAIGARGTVRAAERSGPPCDRGAAAGGHGEHSGSGVGPQALLLDEAEIRWVGRPAWRCATHPAAVERRPAEESAWLCSLSRQPTSGAATCPSSQSGCWEPATTCACWVSQSTLPRDSGAWGLAVQAPPPHTVSTAAWLQVSSSLSLLRRAARSHRDSRWASVRTFHPRFAYFPRSAVAEACGLQLPRNLPPPICAGASRSV